MIEEIVNWGKNNSFVGVLSKSLGSHNADFCVIYLNAGLIHKIGPNRIYVKSARDLAKKGICSFRFDFSGIGDSEQSRENISIEESRQKEIYDALDIIQDKIKTKRFILIGICSGAEAAFAFSLQDKRIIGLSLINGIYQKKELLQNIYPTVMRNIRLRYYKKNIFSVSRWRKVIAGKSKIFNVQNAKAFLLFKVKFFSRPIRNIQDANETAGLTSSFDLKDWDELLQRDMKIQMIFCEGDPSSEIFNLTIGPFLKTKRYSNLIEIQLINDVDHTFTPIWSQEVFMNVISNWILSAITQNTKY